MTGVRVVVRTLTLVSMMIIMAALLGACGYHTAGRGTQLPPTVQTIAVPAFVNKTQQYKIEQQLTRAVVREFQTRTKYRIVNKADPDADAILHGTVTSVSASPATFDSNTGRASSVLVTVSMNVSLVDRKGKVLYENAGYTFREQYQISQDLPTFFEEESPAMQRLSSGFAQTLVSDVLEAF